MAEYTYTTVPGKIKSLLEKVRQVGVPPKASTQWLKTIGFTSSNDTSLLGVLKTVCLIDPSGVPSGTWLKYRGVDHKLVLGEAIQGGYAELFAIYPDAWKQPNTAIEHVFSTSSGAGKQVIAKTVATFKSLCECAEFVEDGAAPDVHAGSTHSNPSDPSTLAAPSRPVASNSPNHSVHIDIQIHISPEAATDQIDQIFKSMAKHLYGATDAK